MCLCALLCSFSSKNERLSQDYTLLEKRLQEQQQQHAAALARINNDLHSARSATTKEKEAHQATREQLVRRPFVLMRGAGWLSLL